MTDTVFYLCPHCGCEEKMGKRGEKPPSRSI